jgi:hypothetical protein
MATRRRILWVNFEQVRQKSVQPLQRRSNAHSGPLKRVQERSLLAH